ncbi:MAG TPA: copper chaperone PCu(A)C [Pyrinomonadaceae bacterium]|jgi:copper(I)-binding protein|nr:copper chaperone PCu(A)C [Pyrinomonadaceae bacterium]
MVNITYVLLAAILSTPNWLVSPAMTVTWESVSQYAKSMPSIDEVAIRNGWIQEGPPSQKITAAYMVIENHGHADITLQSASTPIAQTTELHKMELTDGIMKMRRVDSINIPAGGSVELKPGGYHLMVIGLTRELKEGDMVSIALTFSDGLRKNVKVPVKLRSAMIKEG